MQPTRCLSRGFWSRSLDDFKRLSAIAFSSEGVRRVTTPYELYSFQDPQAVAACKEMSDEEIGGFSTSKLEFIPGTASPSLKNTTSPPSRTTSSKPPAYPPSPSPKAYTRFHGTISTALPPSDPTIQRTGYAAFRTPDPQLSLFGRGLWDIDPYKYLALRIRSDGRAYFINLQTESVVPTDLHQHRLFARRPGQWETVRIKWSDFVRTNFGYVVEPQAELLRRKVKSVGVGLTDRVEGPFELCIERIWATNDPGDNEDGEITGMGAKNLKTKSGGKAGLEKSS